MTTAFQLDLFQLDSFQILAGAEEEVVVQPKPHRGGGGSYWVRVDSDEELEIIGGVSSPAVLRFTATVGKLTQGEEPAKVTAVSAGIRFTATTGKMRLDDTAEVIDLVKRIAKRRSALPDNLGDVHDLIAALDKRRA